MSALCQIADIAEIELNEQKDRLAAVFVNLTRLFLPFGLNNWRFALANRSFSFIYAPVKTKFYNHRANYNQVLFHSVTLSQMPKSVRPLFHLHLISS
jgi:hypothetical protein